MLVPLYVDAGELWTVLTKRTDTLPSHRSQIAFPGGGREFKEDPWGAALREAQEEIGLEPKAVLSLGELDEVESPGRLPRHPLRRSDPPTYQGQAQPRRDRRSLQPPLYAFANPKLVEEREVLSTTSSATSASTTSASRQIWGLTARMLQNLLVRLGLESEEEKFEIPVTATPPAKGVETFQVLNDTLYGGHGDRGTSRRRAGRSERHGPSKTNQKKLACPGQTSAPRNGIALRRRRPAVPVAFPRVSSQDLGSSLHPPATVSVSPSGEAAALLCTPL